MPTQRLCKIGVIPASMGYVCLALLTYYALFYLPYRFPPSLRVSSDSYVFGYNNSVAILSIVVLLALTTFISLLRSSELQRPPIFLLQENSTQKSSPLPLSVYGTLALLYFLLTLAIYLKAQTAPFYNIDWESSYFLWRLKLMAIYDRLPYIDFQFDYGPALIYAPSYFYRFLQTWSVSHESSYYAFHYLVDLLGLYCLYSLLNRSFISAPYKIFIFVVFSLATFAPYMGLNGIGLRYLFPFLSLSIIHRQLATSSNGTLLIASSKIFLLIFLATVINISISSEIGIAFSISLLTYLVFSMRKDLYLSVIALGSFALALSLCYIILPKPYYEAMFSFSKGANNFPLVPAVHLLFYISSLFLVIPKLLTTAILHRHIDSSLLFSLGILCLTLIPGAFGRCDPPHVFFYGLGVSLIASILLAQSDKKRFLVYMSLYIGIFIFAFQWSNIRVFGITFETVVSRDFIYKIRSKLGLEWEENKTAKKIEDLPNPANQINHLLITPVLEKYSEFGLPFANYGTDKRTEKYLFSRRKISPEYYMGAVGVYTEEDLSKKLEDISQHEYLLWMRKYWKFHERYDSCRERLAYIRRSFIFPIDVPCKNEGLDTHAEISKYIAASYGIVEAVGDYIILKRIDWGDSDFNR